MNILFLMKVFEIGGQEVVTATLAKTFVEHGHNVMIASFKALNPMMVARLDKRIKTFTIGEFRYSHDNVKKLKTILADNGVNLVINQWGLPYIPAKVLGEAKRRLNIRTIAIYHNQPDMNARIKSVEIELANEANPIKRAILNAKKMAFKLITSQSMRYVYNHSDLYMVLSTSFVEKFKAFTGIRYPKHLVVQTNPVTTDSSGYGYSRESKQKEVIYVGRIDYNQKRVHRIIETWALTEEHFPDWRLTIVGDGAERKNMEKLACDMNLSRISFEGFQRPEPYYRRASVLVLASEYEGFPLVLAECMSFGVVPVVYGSYSAVYDIIKSRANGIVVTPQGDGFHAEDMADALAYVMADGERLDRMARQAVATSRDYSLDTIYRQWTSVFDSLLAK